MDTTPNATPTRFVRLIIVTFALGINLLLFTDKVTSLTLAILQKDYIFIVKSLIFGLVPSILVILLAVNLICKGNKALNTTLIFLLTIFVLAGTVFSNPCTNTHYPKILVNIFTFLIGNSKTLSTCFP
ncbi:MAG: hypothetical protein AAB512_05060 [Patescibacteria group bacterium]